MHSILIIEDDAAIRGNMELILQMEGFAVRAVPDGLSGIASFREERPDLILCDILMDGLDGHSVLTALMKGGELANVPFIFVTALGDRGDIRRGMAAGADDYLTKPFTAEELISAVTCRLHRIETMLIMNNSMSFQEERAVLRGQVSARERQVLLLVGRGVTSKEIATRLGISLRTVEVHRSNLMRKLGAANVAILARWAIIAELM